MLKDNQIKHLAIIMDGNGRWAKFNGKLRTSGHEEGAKKLKQITEHIAKTGIEFLTLYAFSTENWKRPKSEVNSLMKLLKIYLKKERQTLIKNNIKFKFIGDIEPFSKDLKMQILKTQEDTKNCTKLTQIIALNYGSKNEMVRTIKKLFNKNIDITEENIDANLDTNFAGNVDLLIRTGGQTRLSNFLLWQSAYAELSFTQTLWPEFTCKELDEIILNYKKTHRRFGGL